MNTGKMVINCGGYAIDLSSPKIMAICNITKDSFFEGSRIENERKLVDVVAEALQYGADFVDIGGMSSRPGAIEIPLEDEIKNVSWAIKIIKREFPKALISVDTYRSLVVDRVMEHGIHFVNDISGGHMDRLMIETVGKYDLPYVLMHMKGIPFSMQKSTEYGDQGVILNLMNYFKNKIRECQISGIEDIIIDPGFGFGKSIEDNYRLLKQLKSFEIFDLPILIGLSRKSMIYKVLGLEANTALNGTTALHMIGLMNGAKILRVHDVAEAKECISLFQQYQNF